MCAEGWRLKKPEKFDEIIDPVIREERFSEGCLSRCVIWRRVVDFQKKEDQEKIRLSD